LALITKDHNLFLVFCFIAEIAIFAGTAPVNSVLVLNAPSHAVALTQGVTIALINLFGTFLAPIIVGYFTHFVNLREALQLCTIALLFSGIIWVLGSRKV